MKIESFEGIILSEINYNESSKILNVATDKFGLIGVMSKGCRNMKSKLRGVSRKLLYGKFFVYYKPNSLSTLISVDVINSFSKTMMDLERISYASFIIDLTHQVLRQSNEKEIFEILKQTLIKIEEGMPPLPLTNIIELKLLEFLGVLPKIDSCSHCGSTKDIITLSSNSGGFVCKSCYKNEYIVSEKTIKTIRMYYYVDISSISKINVSEKTSKEINYFLDEYYDKYTGLYIKSKDFIKRINQLEDK